MQPEIFYFTDNDLMPNSKLPVLLYRGIFNESGEDAAVWLEKRFAFNDWTNSWRWGIYDFHHYHSNTHEVLGVFSGSATIRLGGESGLNFNLSVGDILVIPAGVGHKCLSHSADFQVVGAYPNGAEPDLNKGLSHERPLADENIKAVAIPETDPLLGVEGGLRDIWK